MQPTDILKSGLAYIEQNLKTDITAEELAHMAGYSAAHYQHLFTQTVGMPVAAYIGKRRLDRALHEIAGGRRAVDAALEYGFDTYAGFYKAFVRAYGGSPRKILSERVSIMFTEKELRAILANWDVPQDISIMDVYVMDGAKVSGNVWAVGEEYILKIGDREKMLKNLDIAKALAAQGLAAALPVPTKTGTEYLDAGKIMALTRGIKGAPLAKADRFGDDRRAFGRRYGESIARLHRALAAIEPEIQPQEQNLYAQVTEWALPELKKQNEKFHMSLPDGFFEDYIHTFGTLAATLPRQLIHRDPHPSNILFDGGKVSGFIDFDLSERDVRLWDPCYCATGMLSEWSGVDGIQGKWPETLAGILQGYDSVNPLTVEEKQTIFYMLCSIQMICIAYFENVDEYKELAQTNREMLRYIVEQKEQINQIFG
ncbi:MAG: phosphotransferase [Oscillospiraceae bacterium]|nr:phosphotransferase [Oscillospiraceae bacterium]